MQRMISCGHIVLEGWTRGFNYLMIDSIFGNISRDIDAICQSSYEMIYSQILSSNRPYFIAEINKYIIDYF